MDVTTLNLPGIPKLRSGKVREVFDLGADGFLLVATDRLSAFDCVLPDPDPREGPRAHADVGVLVPAPARTTTASRTTSSRRISWSSRNN